MYDWSLNRYPEVHLSIFRPTTLARKSPNCVDNVSKRPQATVKKEGDVASCACALNTRLRQQALLGETWSARWVGIVIVLAVSFDLTRRQAAIESGLLDKQVALWKSVSFRRPSLSWAPKALERNSVFVSSNYCSALGVWSSWKARTWRRKGKRRACRRLQASFGGVGVIVQEGCMAIQGGPRPPSWSETLSFITVWDHYRNIPAKCWSFT